MTDDELIAWVRESRVAQGLPPQIEDPVFLAKVAYLLFEDAA